MPYVGAARFFDLAVLEKAGLTTLFKPYIV